MKILNVFREGFDALDTWRLNGTNFAIFVGCEVVVIIESFVERSSIQRMKDDVLCSRLVLLRKC